jgi:hypothetical protein
MPPGDSVPPASHSTPSAERIERMVNDLRTLAQVIDLTEHQYHARVATSDARSRLDQLDRVIAGSHRHTDAFDVPLQRLYQHPADARAAFLHVAEHDGIAVASERLRTAPERFGPLHEAPPHASLGERRAFAVRQRDVAAAAALEGAAMLHARDAAWDTTEAVQTRRLDALFRQELATLYANPTVAREMFLLRAGDHGAHAVAAQMRRDPETFGALRETLTPWQGTAWASVAADTGRAWAEAELRLGEALAFVPTVQQAADRADRTHARFERSLAAVYTEPQHVRQVFHAVADEHGLTAAVTELREHATRFGQLRASSDTQQAPRSAPLAPELLDTLVRRARADYRAQQNFGLAVHVEQHQSRGVALRSALHDAYVAANDVWQQVAKSVQTIGVIDTARRLQEQPTAFGTLRTVPLRDPHHGRVIDPRNATRTAAVLSQAYYATPNPVATVRAAAWKDWIAARHREGRARAALHHFPARTVLERRIAATLQRMTPHEITQVRQMLTQPQVAVAQRLLTHAKAYLRGAEHER